MSDTQPAKLPLWVQDRENVPLILSKHREPGTHAMLTDTITQF